MRTYNTYFSTASHFGAYVHANQIEDGSSSCLIQVFTFLTDPAQITEMRDAILSFLPRATLIGVSTNGEICNGHVTTGKSVVSITMFEKTTLYTDLVENTEGCRHLGETLARSILNDRTKLMIAFTDGVYSNSEYFLDGIRHIRKDVVVSGGMAGDNATFKKTVIFNNTKLTTNGAVGVSFANPDLFIHTDYFFNWYPIGKPMRVTKAEGNRLYMLDDKPVYEVYKHYLGDEVAQRLPSASIDFPLIVQRDDTSVARTVLHVHSDGSMTFPGDLKEGEIVRFGYGDIETILSHARTIPKCLKEHPAESIFIYSCMARRRFMPKLIEEEIAPLAKIAETSGFFTYGEFYTDDSRIHLLNHTMTILVLSESAETYRKNTDVTISTSPIENDGYRRSVKTLFHLLDVTIEEMQTQYKELSYHTDLIKAKKASLSKAQEIGNFGSWEIDLKSKRSKWSKQSFRIYGLDPETTKPTLDTFLSLVVPEDRPRVIRTIEDALDGTIKTIKVKAVRADGTPITLLINGKIIFNDDGSPKTLLGTTLDITEQVKLHDYNEELASIIEHSSNEIYIIEKGTYNYLYVNRTAIEKLGYSREELYNMNVLDINKHLTKEDIDTMQAQLIAQGSLTNRTFHTKKNGDTYPVQSYIQYRTYHGKEVGVIFDIDISDFVEAERKQQEQAQILEQLQDAIISTDLNDTITYWNHGATLMHGYRAEEMIGKHIKLLYLPEDTNTIDELKQHALTYGICRREIQKKTRSGKVIFADVSISVLRDANGNIIGLTRVSKDITHKKEIETKLRAQTRMLNFQAFHDALTMLPNRTYFEKSLEQSLFKAQKESLGLGLLFIDLDNFKQINDTLGHHYGDTILKIIAERLKHCIRREDLLARLGGDEFTILIRNISHAEDIAKIAQNVIDTLNPPIKIDNHELHISASIGICRYPKDAQNKNDLLKFADTAMYKAKATGRNNYQFYSQEMTQMAFEKIQIESSLRKAVTHDEFVIHYQPQIDARDDTLIGMEALVRWNHPKYGLLSPDRFIHIAEESHLIKEIDTIVMHRTLLDIKAWYDAGLSPGILSLNLSIKQFMNDTFFDMLEKAIKNIGFDVNYLKFEITESQMMHDPKHSIKTFNTIRDMGIKLAVDDFGTGYSSLAYLKRFPVETLKIDRSFIKDLPYDEEDRAISKAIIALAKSLNMSLIAEGVETEAQKRYLLDNGCHYIQGYYYSKPIPKDEMTDYLKQIE